MNPIVSIGWTELISRQRKEKCWKRGLTATLALLLANACWANEAPSDLASLAPEEVFKQVGSDAAESFAALLHTRRFEVMNPSSANPLLQFEFSPDVKVTPEIVRLVPGGRQAVTMELRPGAHPFALKYAVALSAQAFVTHHNRYRAYSDGETVMCVPVTTATFSALKARTSVILEKSTIELTDPGMPPGTIIYTPGPFYRTACLFARDFLFQLEDSGKYFMTAAVPDELFAATGNGVAANWSASP